MKKKLYICSGVFACLLLGATMIYAKSLPDADTATLESSAVSPQPNVTPTIMPSQSAQETTNPIVFNPAKFYANVDKITIYDNEIPTIVLTNQKAIASFKEYVSGNWTEKVVDGAVGCNFTVEFYSKDNLLFSLHNAGSNGFHLTTKGYNCDPSKYDVSPSQCVTVICDKVTLNGLQELACKYSKTYRDYDAGLIQFDEKAIQTTIIEK